MISGHRKAVVQENLLYAYPNDPNLREKLFVDFYEHFGQVILEGVEIFDAEPPHRPVGCFAQAWSVSEVLRAYGEYAQ